MVAMAEWSSGFFAHRHRQFVKDGMPWWFYIAEFWPSAIDNTVTVTE